MNGSAAMAPGSVFRAGYEWNFLTTTEKSTPVYSSADLRLVTPPVPMPSRTYLDLDFSIKPKSVVISRADDEKLEAFMELIDVGSGPIITPAATGLYACTGSRQILAGGVRSSISLPSRSRSPRSDFLKTPKGCCKKQFFR